MVSRNNEVCWCTRILWGVRWLTSALSCVPLLLDRFSTMHASSSVCNEQSLRRTQTKTMWWAFRIAYLGHKPKRRHLVLVAPTSSCRSSYSLCEIDYFKKVRALVPNRFVEFRLHTTRHMFILLQKVVCRTETKQSNTVAWIVVITTQPMCLFRVL